MRCSRQTHSDLVKDRGRARRQLRERSQRRRRRQMALPPARRRPTASSAASSTRPARPRARRRSPGDRRAACRGSAARCARDRRESAARCATTADPAAACTCLSARLIGIGIVEHERARQQEIRDAAERVDVGAAVDRRFAQRHLRRDVARRARGVPSIVNCVVRSSPAMNLARPKSSTLTKSWCRPTLQIMTFDGFRSRWTRPCRCASSSDSADRRQDRQHASGRLRAERRHERLEADAVEQLHHVVEAPIARHAEVVEVDRVRRLQTRR